MRQLFPEPVETIDPAAVHARAHRPRPADRPWVVVNMVASVDGATAVDGVSGPLGGEGDRAVFTALRSMADVILAAAGTVRAEGYGPPRTPEAQQAARLDRGQLRWPRIAVVTRSLDLDLDAPLFADTPVRPIVVTTEDADPERRAAAGRRATVILSGTGRVDLPGAVRQLGAHADLVLCEGGPSLNGQLLADGVIDEVCLTVAPALANGDSARIMHHPDPTTARLTLTSVWEHEGSLFLRYLRAGEHQNDSGTTSR